MTRLASASSSAGRVPSNDFDGQGVQCVARCESTSSISSRVIRRSPASAAAAILTLALTLGAGASIFAVVDAVLLTPPPFADPDALVTVGETPRDDRRSTPRATGYATLEAWRDRADRSPRSKPSIPRT